MARNARCDFVRNKHIVKRLHDYHFSHMGGMLKMQPKK